MNKSLFVSALLAIAACATFCQPAFAQRTAGCPMAIIDMNYIFENYTRFKLLAEDLKKEIDQAEIDFKAGREALRKLAQQLETFTKGTDDYRQLEEEVARGSADLQLKTNIQKKDFADREARNFYDVHQEVVERVKDYCAKQGVLLVLKFNGEPMKDMSPQEVLRGLNNMVVYSHSSVDITPVILEELNQAASSPRSAKRESTGVRPRQGVPRQ